MPNEWAIVIPRETEIIEAATLKMVLPRSIVTSNLLGSPNKNKIYLPIKPRLVLIFSIVFLSNEKSATSAPEKKD